MTTATPAILKVVIIPEVYLLPIQLGWMAACVVVPYLAFLVRRAAPAQQLAEHAHAPLISAGS
jgi:hypothetical protein